MTGPVSVVRFGTALQALPDGDESWLSPAERERMGRLHRAADRQAYLAAHLLVRRVTAELLGCPVDRVRIRQRCPDCGALGHGRAEVVGHPDVALSLSHSVRGDSAVVAAVAALAAAPIGIDVEHRDAAIPARALSPQEWGAVASGWDPVLLWTRKEAAVKAGTGAGAGGLGRAADISVLEPDAGLVFADWAGEQVVGSWAYRAAPAPSVT